MDRRDLLSFADFVLHGDSAGEGGHHGTPFNRQRQNGSQVGRSRHEKDAYQAGFRKQRPQNRDVLTLQLSRAQRVRAKYRFVLQSPDSEAPSAAPKSGSLVGLPTSPTGSHSLSATPQWSRVFQIVVDADEPARFRCPVCLDSPLHRAPVMSRCGHIFCSGCWLSYVAASDAAAATVLHNYNTGDSNVSASATAAAARAAPSPAMPPSLRGSVTCPVCAEWCEAATVLKAGALFNISLPRPSTLPPAQLQGCTVTYSEPATAYSTATAELLALPSGSRGCWAGNISIYLAKGHIWSWLRRTTSWQQRRRHEAVSKKRRSYYPNMVLNLIK